MFYKCVHPNLFPRAGIQELLLVNLSTTRNILRVYLLLNIMKKSAGRETTATNDLFQAIKSKDYLKKIIPVKKFKQKEYS